ncbi:MAG TPA: hypothetical protein VHF01_10880 [Candidatus Acidoferrum sp.]|nr:hypothetical protein [Candidatus Acidoferrum sp.]
MLKRIAGLLVVVLAVFSVPIALSQMERAQPVYTYVSQFQVPRANWAQFAEDNDKTFVPVMERFMADGTIMGWSTFETMVHTPDGYTNGSSWSSNSLAGIMCVLDELRKGGPRPGQLAATKHEDYLMQSTMHHASTVTGGSGYLRVVCQMAKADRPGEYAAALNKYLVPTFEEQFKKGVATSYGVDEQYVNSSAPSLRCLVITYPNAEGMDKWATAINATLGKMSDADRAAFFGSTVADSRRDFMARITHYAHK